MRDLAGGGAPRADIVRLIAAALVFEITSSCRAVAQAFRHQHRKAARDQPCRERAILGLRHLRATQLVLRRGVRNHRQPERPIARRTKQKRLRRSVRLGRGHQPLLHSVRLGLRPLRTETDLCGRSLRTQGPEPNQSEKHPERLHEFA